MANKGDLVNEYNRVVDEFWELWKELTTTQRHDVPHPQDIAAYNQSRENWKAIQDIKAILQEQNKERSKLKEALKRGIGFFFKNYLD